jgi:hypothetical protein
LIWVCREKALIQQLLPHFTTSVATNGQTANASNRGKLEIQVDIYMGSSKETLDVGGESGAVLPPNTTVRTGRPDVNSIIQHDSQCVTNMSGHRLAVHACGPVSLTREVRICCDSSLLVCDSQTIRCDYQEEVFCF